MDSSRKELLRRIQTKIDECATRRREILQKIHESVSNTDEIETQADVLADIRSQQLPKVRDQITSLAVAIGDIAQMSRTSCERVQQYDIMNDRVQKAIRIAEAMLSHKKSLHEIHEALTLCDYERAATLAQTCSKLREEYQGVTCFNEDIDSAAVDVAISKVQDSLRDELSAALRRGDADMVMRFTRLFPLVGLVQEGYERYIKFVRELARKDLAQHVDTSLQGIGQKVSHLLLVSQILDHVVSVMEREEKNASEMFGVIDAGADAGLQALLLELHAECTTHSVNVLTAYQKYAASAGQQSRSVKYLDRTLDEISQLTSCCHLYLTYVDARLRKGDTGTRHRFSAALTDTKLTTSRLFDKVQELLNLYFPLQKDYFSAVAQEALKTDEGSGMQFLDDTIYIFRNAIRRVMNTKNIVIVCSVVNLVNDTIKDNIVTEVQKYLVIREGHVAVGKKSLGWLNTAVCAVDYTNKLAEEIINAVEDHFAGRSADIAMCIEHTIDFRSTSDQLRNDVNGFLTHVASHVSNNILSKGLPEFMQMSYVLGESAYVRYESNDPWARSALLAWDTILQPYKKHLTEDLFSQLLGEVAKLVVAQLESGIVRKAYDAFGALQLDKDVRSVTRFFCDRSVTPIRESFTRVSQMSGLLALERVAEAGDYVRAIDSTWCLTASEVRSVLSCRSDFPRDHIHGLKLPFS